MTGIGTIQAGNELVFLKLGGSLITDKLTPRTARPGVIQRIADEIAAALSKNPQLLLVLGHGSGSFGHTSGKKYHTREGVSTREDWLGFAEVWFDAATLNHLVMEALTKAGLAAIAYPPSASVYTEDGKIISWDLSSIQSTLEKRLLPVVFGDVVFDSKRGGTILSTEDLFVHLSKNLNPQRILLGGLDPGVWQDYPDCTQLYEELTPVDSDTLRENVSQSNAPDVTGGMADKVQQMLDLISQNPNLESLIFSGAEPGAMYAALLGETPGTRLHK
ncbi:MAG: isopentenyl phosphate kinase family protein [Chloroflexi bacterium]|nr:isopentenyl phosphate kinase family protein [Chloroflexota bacterium]